MASPDEQGIPAAPQKPVRKPPSPHIPRLFAALAIITLLAVPIVVPIAVMKTTGKSGRRGVDLDEAIEAPPPIVAAAPEEVTKEEVKESFLRLSNKKVRRTGAVGAIGSNVCNAPPCTPACSPELHRQRTPNHAHTCVGSYRSCLAAQTRAGRPACTPAALLQCFCALLLCSCSSCSCSSGARTTWCSSRFFCASPCCLPACL